MYVVLSNVVTSHHSSAEGNFVLPFLSPETCSVAVFLSPGRYATQSYMHFTIDLSSSELAINDLAVHPCDVSQSRTCHSLNAALCAANSELRVLPSNFTLAAKAT